MARTPEQEARYQELKARAAAAGVEGDTVQQLSFASSSAPSAPRPQPAPAPAPPAPHDYTRQDVPDKYITADADGKPYPGLFDMPELNEMSVGALKTRFGKAMGADSNDVRELLKKDLGIETSVSPSGWLIAKSKKDGKEYVSRSGTMEWSDITHGVAGAIGTAGATALATGGAGALLPGAAAALGGPGASLVGRMVGGGLAGGFNSALNELGQGAVGLQMDPNMPVANALIGTGVPAVGAAVKAGVKMLPEAVGGATAVEKAAVQAADAAEARAKTPLQNLVQGAGGNLESQSQVANALERGPAIKAATDVLGITEDMPPHMLADLSNQEARRMVSEIAKAESSVLKTSAGALTQERLKQAGGKIISGLEAAGASVDLGDAALQTGGVASRIHAGMETAEKVAWELAGLNPQIRIEAPQPLFDYVKKQFGDNLKNFPKIKSMVEELTFRSREQGKNGQFLAGTGNVPRMVTLQKYITETGKALRSQDPDWKSVDKGWLKNLYNLLEQTREATAANIMDPKDFAAAKLLTVAKKRYEKRLETLFGKKVEDALSEDLFAHVVPAIKKAYGSGNTTPAPQKLLSVIGAMQNLPEDVQANTLLSGMTSIFRKGGANGQPLNWLESADVFHKLDAQKRVKTALWSKFSPEGRKLMDAFSTTAKQTGEILRQLNPTGNTTTMAKEMQDADAYVGRLVSMMGEKLPAIGAIVGAVVNPQVVPGSPRAVGTIGGALVGHFAQKVFQGVHTSQDQAVAAFLTSSEFPKLIARATTHVPLPWSFFQRITDNPVARRLAIAMKIPMPDFQKMLRDAMPAFMPGRVADAAAATGARVPAAAVALGTQPAPPTPDEEK